MTVLFRWILISTLTRVAAIAIAVVLIFMIGESIDKARYLGDGLNMTLLGEYLILKVPYMISKFMPVIALLGVAVYVIEISRHHELVALRAAGVKFFTLLQPMLVAGVMVAVLMFALGEWVEPLVNKRLNYIDRVYIEKEQALQQGVQWLHESNTFMRLTPLIQNYFAVLMTKRGKDGLWIERLDANKASYASGAWHLENVIQTNPSKTGGFAIKHFDKLTLKSNLSPQTVAAPDPRDMQWLDLYHFERALAEAGLDSKHYLYQLQRKLAAPISCLIMMILAYGLCSNMGERVGSKSQGLLLTIGTGLLFHVLNSAIEAFVSGGQLPVLYAAWLPNVLFLSIAGYTLLKREGY